MKQKHYETLDSSELHTETVNQLMAYESTPVAGSIVTSFWGTNENVLENTLSNSYLVRQDWVATRLTWCMAGLTLGEYASEETKRSKEEKVLLMTHLRDLISCEGAAVALVKRRDAPFYDRLLLKQMSSIALNTCARMLKEGSDLGKTLLLQAPLDIQHSEPLNLIMKLETASRKRTPGEDRPEQKIFQQRFQFHESVYGETLISR